MSHIYFLTKLLCDEFGYQAIDRSAELRDFTRQALRSSKTPDRFWFLDALPRTETGKLLRRLVPGLIPPATTE